jgi:plastocyanin
VEVIDMRRLLFLLALVATFGLLMACSQAEADLEGVPAARTNRVVVEDMKFTPQVIEVPAGTTVTWSFTDGDTPHDVRGDGFKSEVMRTGTFPHRFSDPGVYDYRCTLHPQMAGRVIVAA